MSAHAQFCSHSHLPSGFRLSARVSFDLDSRTTFVQTVRLFTSLRIQRKHGLKAEPPRALLNEPIFCRRRLHAGKPFFRCSKILGETGKQEVLQQMFRKF